MFSRFSDIIKNKGVSILDVFVTINWKYAESVNLFIVFFIWF